MAIPIEIYLISKGWEKKGYDWFISYWPEGLSLDEAAAIQRARDMAEAGNG